MQMRDLVTQFFSLENATRQEQLDSCTLIIASLDSCILLSPVHCFITLHFDVETSMHLHYTALSPVSTKSANTEANAAGGII